MKEFRIKLLKCLGWGAMLYIVSSILAISNPEMDNAPIGVYAHIMSTAVAGCFFGVIWKPTASWKKFAEDMLCLAVFLLVGVAAVIFFDYAHRVWLAMYSIGEMFAITFVPIVFVRGLWHLFHKKLP